VTGAPAGRFEWEQAVRSARLGLRDVAVALAMATFSTTRTGGDIRPGDGRVARGLGVDRRTVERARRSLVAGGFLRVVREGGPGRAGEYLLTLPPGMASGECAHPGDVSSGEWGGSRTTDGTLPPGESASSRPGSPTTSTGSTSTSPVTSTAAEGTLERGDPWALAEHEPSGESSPPLERVELPGLRRAVSLAVDPGWEADVERSVTERDQREAQRPRRPAYGQRL